MPGGPSAALVPPWAASGSATALAVDPSAILAAPAPLRAAAAFVAVGVLGWFVRWRSGPFVERAIDASMERPLASLGYGVAAHAAVALGVVYLVTQLAQLLGGGATAAMAGVVLGLLLALTAAAVGFTVVGSTLITLARPEERRYSPAVGGAIAGLAAALDPLPGGLLWFVVVSMGIGGAARRWVNADAVEEL